MASPFTQRLAHRGKFESNNACRRQERCHGPFVPFLSLHGSFLCLVPLQHSNKEVEPDPALLILSASLSGTSVLDLSGEWLNASTCMRWPQLGAVIRRTSAHEIAEEDEGKTDLPAYKTAPLSSPLRPSLSKAIAKWGVRWVPAPHSTHSLPLPLRSQQVHFLYPPLLHC